MAKTKLRDVPDLSDLARADMQITVRVTPKAARTRLTREGKDIRAVVTAAPENGKANAAVQVLLAKAMGISPSELKLLRGQKSRTKVFVYSGDGSERS